ncbi:hypothetical protein B4134_2794 [Bacillus safensis]|nr:hypothetical protein B4107_2577 [Bacillus safensis]KIL26048.1 hypothetical protein B4134_2794 [Bacillus safensis]
MSPNPLLKPPINANMIGTTVRATTGCIRFVIMRNVNVKTIKIPKIASTLYPSILFFT